MSEIRLLSSTDAVNQFAEKLCRLLFLHKFDQAGDPEAGALANAFGDLEKSFQNFNSVLLPRLVHGALSKSESQAVLLEIGEEFRHILYHIFDLRFYSYLGEGKSAFQIGQGE